MKLTLAIFWLAILVVDGVAAGSELQWAFNAPRGDGYSIHLESAEPKPGTPLVRGASAHFKLAVSYALDNADHGAVILVFQDEKNQNVTGERKQTTVKVTQGRGTLTLADSVAVPINGNELRLFIPLVPDGMKKTTGEITIRYPITTSPEGPQYMPYPLAKISAEEWEQYHHSVQASCGSSHRASPKEHLDVFECSANSLHLAFTTDGHPAHPAWVTRQVREGTIDQIGYFAGQEEPFAELFRSYLDLTDRTLKKTPKDAK